MALTGKKFPNITVSATNELGDTKTLNILELAQKEKKKVMKGKSVRNPFRKLTEYKVYNEELFKYSCEAKKERGSSICKNKAQKKYPKN